MGVVSIINVSCSLAIFCCMPVVGGMWAYLRQWACPLVTFDVVNYIFVVVCRCGPMINLSRSLSFVWLGYL